MQHVVVLKARGGSEIGIGHLSRTATLATAIQQSGQVQRVLLIWQTTTELAEQFAPDQCELHLAANDDQATHPLQALCQQADRLTLVTDLLHLNEQDIAHYREVGCDTIVHLNDSGAGRWHADMVVDGDAFKSSEDVPDTFLGTALMGASYRMIRPSVVAMRPNRSWSKPQVQKLLVTFGGADPHHLTAKLLALLAAFPGELPFSIQAVIGPAFDSDHQKQLEAHANAHPQITVQRTEQLESLILQHDLIITLGGITAYEVMCLGRPCVAIQSPETGFYSQQLAAARLLVEFDSVATAAAELAALSQNRSVLEEFAQRGWDQIDGQGAERVTHAMVSTQRA